MKSLYKIFVTAALVILIGCEEFVSVDLPNTQLTSGAVFESDATATAAALSMYESMLRLPGFGSSGSSGSIATVCGVYSDEFSNYLDQNSVFADNNVDASNSTISTLWSSAYYTIFTANAVLEGVEKGHVSDELKHQLMGEAKFVRAFTLFYLTNLFGDVPIVTTTDYRINADLSRSSVVKVYEQIVNDLLDARELLPDHYVTSERARPNAWSATALLARVYLYTGEWVLAETMTNVVIDNSGMFSLEADLSKTFLKTTPEAIWQISSLSPTSYNTYEGYYYILNAAPSIVALSEASVDAFEENDGRLTNWVGTFTTGENTYHYVNKYKLKGGSSPLSEHSIVLRLAEQYLIRAESRLHQGKLIGMNSAQSDIDAIRNRAGLSNTTAITEAELLLAIEQERRVELMGEWSHRWFDLKRTNRAHEVLSPIKPSWDINDLIFPIPESELISNPRLLPQNTGY